MSRDWERALHLLPRRAKEKLKARVESGVPLCVVDYTDPRRLNGPFPIPQPHQLLLVLLEKQTMVRLRAPPGYEIPAYWPRSSTGSGRIVLWKYPAILTAVVSKNKVEMVEGLALVGIKLEGCRYDGPKCDACECINDLLRCAGCMKVWYCDQLCQRERWKEHKLVCRK